MIKTSIELIAENIGFDIAHSDDRVQADLLNGLGRGFNTYTDHQLNMQIAYVVQHLKPETKKLILTIAEYLKDE